MHLWIWSEYLFNSSFPKSLGSLQADWLAPGKCPLQFLFFNWINFTNFIGLHTCPLPVVLVSPSVDREEAGRGRGPTGVAGCWWLTCQTGQQAGRGHTHLKKPSRLDQRRRAAPCSSKFKPLPHMRVTITKMYNIVIDLWDHIIGLPALQLYNPPLHLLPVGICVPSQPFILANRYNYRVFGVRFSLFPVIWHFSATRCRLNSSPLVFCGFPSGKSATFLGDISVIQWGEGPRFNGDVKTPQTSDRSANHHLIALSSLHKT